MSDKKLNINPIRRVLFEKYSKEIEMEEFFIYKLDGCSIERFGEKRIYGNYEPRITILLYKRGVMVLMLDSKNLIDKYGGGEIWYLLHKKFKTERIENIDFIKKRRYGVFNFLNCF